jgi:hypothetical protein
MKNIIDILFRRHVERNRSTLLFIILLMLCTTIQSQTDEPYTGEPKNDSLNWKSQYKKGIKYQIKTSTGQSYTGWVIDETRLEITIEDRAKDVKYILYKSEIVSGEAISTRQSLEEDLLGDNEHAHTYLFAGSSYQFERTKIYTNYHWFALENINIGISKNWAISVSTLFFLPVSIGTKFSYAISDKTAVGGSACAFGNVFDQEGNAFWGYAALARITSGSSNKNVSASAGLISLNERVFSNAPNQSLTFSNSPFANLAYGNRFAKKWGMAAEGWYFPKSNSAIAGAGLKFIQNDNKCWILGCYVFLNNLSAATNFNLGKTVPLPYIGLSQGF